MYKISRIEWIMLLFVFSLVVLGFVFFFMGKGYFANYTREDGFIEWMTVVGALIGAAACFYRVIKLHKWKSWLFSLTNIVLGIMLFFVAGEEVSWGQRIFNVHPSAYFQQHNTQGETNIHNLVVDHMRLNKIIFSFVLIAVLAIYLIVIPIIYRKNKKFKNFVDSAGAVIPQLYQIISFGLLFLLTSLIPDDKTAELLEFGAAFIFSLIILFPVNGYVFHKGNTIKGT